MPEIQEEAKSVPSGPPSRRRGLVLIVPLVLLGAVAVWFWFSRADSSAAESEKSRVKSTLHLETFTLNVADPEPRAYLRVGIDLGLNQEPKRGEEPAPIAEVRDTILGVLAQARVDDLLTPAGKSQLKQNLLHALQERIPQLGVEEVYFTEFLIQR